MGLWAGRGDRLCQASIQYELVRHVMEVAAEQTVAADVATVKVPLKSETVEVSSTCGFFVGGGVFPAVCSNNC